MSSIVSDHVMKIPLRAICSHQSFNHSAATACLITFAVPPRLHVDQRGIWQISNGFG